MKKYSYTVAKKTEHVVETQILVLAKCDLR